MPAISSKSSEASKITLRLLALIPRLMSTCKICGVIKLVSVTTSKLAKAPSVTGQYFRKYPSARQRSPIVSSLSKALLQPAVVFVTPASFASVVTLVTNISLVTGFSATFQVITVLNLRSSVRKHKIQMRNRIHRTFYATFASLVTGFSANTLDVCANCHRVMKPLRTPRLTASVRLLAPSLAYIEET